MLNALKNWCEKKIINAPYEAIDKYIYTPIGLSAFGKLYVSVFLTFLNITIMVIGFCFMIQMAVAEMMIYNFCIPYWMFTYGVLFFIMLAGSLSNALPGCNIFSIMYWQVNIMCFGVGIAFLFMIFGLIWFGAGIFYAILYAGFHILCFSKLYNLFFEKDKMIAIIILSILMIIFGFFFRDSVPPHKDELSRQTIINNKDIIYWECTIHVYNREKTLEPKRIVFKDTYDNACKKAIETVEYMNEKFKDNHLRFETEGESMEFMFIPYKVALKYHAMDYMETAKKHGENMFHSIPNNVNIYKKFNDEWEKHGIYN